MRGRFTSLMVLIGLLFGMAAMPAMAHASASTTAHSSDMLPVETIEEAGHSHSQGADEDMPCHAISHHHCGMALQLDSARIDVNGLGKDGLLHPAFTAPLVSRSQAPPLDPPLA